MPRFPLEGLRVLDLTRLLPGPYATMLLADLGADVVKVEPPGIGDPVRAMPPFKDAVSALFLQLNRNKRSVAIDLKHEEGVRVFLRLAETADVVIEGFRPGVAKRLGIDHEAIHRVNPRAVYASLSTFGHASPGAEHVGHDLNVVAEAGLLDMNRATGGEIAMPGAQVADLGIALHAVIGVLAALRERDATGKARFLDLSMFDAALSFATEWAAEAAGGMDVRGGKAVLAGTQACYNLYVCSDGATVALGALEPHFWAKACEALGVPHLAKEHISDGKRREDLLAEVRGIMATRDADHWVRAFLAAGVPASRVQGVSDGLASEIARGRGMVLEGGFVNSPLGAAWAAQASYRRAPGLGEHTRDILKEAGFAEEEMRALVARSVVAV